MNIPRPLAIILWPLSLVYGSAVSLRAWLYKRGWLKQKRLNRPVISVGNITVGGTGKTPMVIWLAERLLAEGKRVAILSRGYRGSHGTSDEIELMKRRLKGRAMFGVGPDRYAEGQRLESAGVDVYLLDDGFQYLQLARDVDIVLVDSTRSVEHEFLLPAGRLREPSSAVNRATSVVFTRTEQSKSTVRAIQEFPQFAIYPAVTKLLGFRRHAADDHQEPLRQAVSGAHFAFCGIGNPDAFFADLERWGVPLAGHRAFRDHHRYTPREIAALERAAKAAGANALVTTEKDARNLEQAVLSKLAVEVAVVAMEIPDEAEFLRDLHSKLPLSTGAVAS
jgi:tetraacyldisaccharide 4'-kinase